LDDKFKCKISSDLKDLVNKLLIKNPTDRISWNEYFNHNWIVKDLQLEKENKLLELSITNSSSLPMINLNKSNNPDTKIFNSMKQNSIKDNLSFSLHSSKKLNVSMGSENNFEYNNNDNSKELVNKINNLNFNDICSENSFNMNHFNGELEEDELEENELFFSITNEDDDVEIVNEKSDSSNNTNISKNLSDSDSDYIDSKELKSNSINNFNEEESFILLSNQIPFTKTKPINIPKKINNNTIDNFSIYGDTKNSSEIRKEILEAINCSSQNNDPELSFELKTSYNSIEKNDNYNKNNGNVYSKQVKSNKMFKNVYKNSMMILRESYDYLSSKNKSI
jgi:serine/threonine protein kinase